MNKSNCIIRLETPADYEAAEALTREAFWNVYRPGCLEHYVLHCLRSDPDFIPELDLLLEEDGRLIGQVIFMKAWIAADDGRRIPIVTGGPLSIAPDRQRQGYGQWFFAEALDKAAALGYGAMCFEGNIEFYRHLGFDLASKRRIHYFAEPREEEVPYFLLKEFIPHYLDGVEGVYHTPQGYFVNEAEAEEFDKKFPPKQKLKLPGQLV